MKSSRQQNSGADKTSVNITCKRVQRFPSVRMHSRAYQILGVSLYVSKGVATYVFGECEGDENSRSERTIWCLCSLENVYGTRARTNDENNNKIAKPDSIDSKLFEDLEIIIATYFLFFFFFFTTDDTVVH